jgi:quercetin dioxygenase-like cupin family protein
VPRSPSDYAASVTFRAIVPDEFEWITRPHAPGEAARHVAELSETAGFAHTRANVWRYEPGAKGRRHKHPLQEETFVVLSGKLSMYLGEQPKRYDVPGGGLIHVAPGTAVQTANHGDRDLVLDVYGTPPESEHAELLDSAV